MPLAYLGLGSNEGDRLAHLRAAGQRLEAGEALRVKRASPVYETEAHTLSPDDEQPPYLNAVLSVAMDSSPEELLQRAQAIERAEGRVRSGENRWRPRPLDVDLLAVGTLTRQTDTLTLPHPRLGERRFVLRPWADLAPNFVVPPPFNRSVQSLLTDCPDTAPIRRTAHRLDPSTSAPPPDKNP
jgi:2-amino-4-hydroxy-6-hydroxymethyldihydropteridine diphosphokinase